MQTLEDVFRHRQALFLRVSDMQKMFTIESFSKCTSLISASSFSFNVWNHFENSDTARCFPTFKDVCRSQKTFSDMKRKSADISDIQWQQLQNASDGVSTSKIRDFLAMMQCLLVRLHNTDMSFIPSSVSDHWDTQISKCVCELHWWLKFHQLQDMIENTVLFCHSQRKQKNEKLVLAEEAKMVLAHVSMHWALLELQKAQFDLLRQWCFVFQCLRNVTKKQFVRTKHESQVVPFSQIVDQFSLCHCTTLKATGLLSCL